MSKIYHDLVVIKSGSPILVNDVYNNFSCWVQARLAALHDVIQSGDHKCADDVAILLSSTGVDVNAETPSGGYTALHLAARLTDEFDAEEVSLQLLKHGADPSIKDEVHIRTRSCYGSHLQLIKRFLNG